jgi:hypothetical protein
MTEVHRRPTRFYREVRSTALWDSIVRRGGTLWLVSIRSALRGSHVAAFE